MKRATCIRIVGGENKLLEDLYDHVKHEIPKEWAKKYEYKGGLLEFPLDESSSSYRYVLEICERHRLHPTISEISYYTKAELERVEYFQLHMLSPFEMEGKDAADYGTQYTGGCPNCSLGKEIVGDALVDRKLMKKYNLGQMLPDVYVSESVRDLIVENGFTGASFDHKIKDYKGREMANYYVLSVHNTLLPMSDEAWLRIEDYSTRLEKCGHQAVYLHSDHKYEREKLANAKDFNLTYESLNGLRLQEVIVSARVRQVFKKNKVHAGFFPVTII